MNQIKGKNLYHLTNVEKTLDKLNAENKDHLEFMNDNSDSRFKALWGDVVLKN